MPRKQPRQERATLTIDAIVTAVERILERDGPRALTTNRIAEVAGVSIGTLYQWYPNKEALIGALQARYLEQTLGMCRAALAAAESRPLADAIDGIAAAIAAALRTQRPIQHWLSELRSAAAYQQPWREAYRTFTREVAEFLRRHPDADTIDPDATAFVIVHSLEGIGEALVHWRNELDIDALIREGARMGRRYLLRTPTTPA